jgi:hypothetical protein
MQPFERKRSPELSALLGMLEIVSILGLLYCLVMLADLLNAAPVSTECLLVCMAWFAVSAISVYGILHWKKWGIYALGVATTVLTIINLVQRSATWGGASLGLLIGFIFAVYLRPIWRYFD